MGDRYIIQVKCEKCGYIDDDVYYAPTCGFEFHQCTKCNHVIDLAKYTGISVDDASNKDIIANMIAALLRD